MHRKQRLTSCLCDAQVWVAAALVFVAFSTGYGGNLLASSLYCLNDICIESTNISASANMSKPTCLSLLNGFGQLPKFYDNKALLASGISSLFWAMPVSMFTFGYFVKDSLLLLKVYLSMAFSQAFLTVLMPAVVRASPEASLFLRILQGLINGIDYGSMASVCKLLSSPMHLSTTIAVRMAAYRFGIIAVFLVTPELCRKNHPQYWDAGYYLSTVLLVVSGVCLAGSLYYCLRRRILKIEGHDSDAKHLIKVKKIDRKKKKNKKDEEASVTMEVDVEESKHVDKAVWKRLFTGFGLYGLIVAAIFTHMASIFLFKFLPLYYKQVHLLDLASSRWFSTAPNIAAACMMPSFGVIADYLDRKIKPLASLKILHSSACLIPSLIFFALALSHPSISVAVVLQCVLYVTLSAYVITLSRGSLHLEPQLHLFVNSTVLATGVFGLIIMPYVVEFMPPSDLAHAETKWRNILFMLSAFLAVAWAVYMPIRFKYKEK